MYPENVARLVAIEGLGLPPQFEAKLEEMGIDGRMRRWIDQQRQLAGRQPRRYATIDEALARMQEENRHLSPRSEEHTSELQSLMRISYAVFCLKKKTQQQH